MLNLISFTSYQMLLLGIPLLAGLLYAYRQRRSSGFRKVSSLYIFEKLKARTLPRRKIRLPLRFFADLLILSLLLAAAAGALIKGSNLNIAVVLDDSASMFARQSKTILYELAKQMAADDIRELPEGSQVTLVNSASASLNAALAAGEILGFKNGKKTNFESELSKISASGNFDRLYAYSDKEPDSARGSEKIFYKNLKQKALSNIAILSAAISENGTISAEIRNYSDTEVKFKVVLQSYQNSAVPDLLDEKKYQMSLSESGRAEFEDYKKADFYRLYIESSDSDTDSLTTDSEYYLLAGKNNSGKIICFSAYETTALKLQSFFPGLSDCEQANQYQSLKTADRELTLLIGFIPQDFPQSNALIIADTAAGESGQLIYWRSESEILKYLKSSDLSFTMSSLNKFPAIFLPEIKAENATILASAEISGFRYVLSGFPLFPFDGEKNKALSILLLNITNWLKSSAAPEMKSAAEYYISDNNRLVKSSSLSGQQRYLTAGNSIKAIDVFEAEEADTFSSRFISLPEKFSESLNKESAYSLSIKIVIAALILWLLMQVLFEMISWRRK